MEYGIEKGAVSSVGGCRAFGVLWRGGALGRGAFGGRNQKEQHFLENEQNRPETQAGEVRHTEAADTETSESGTADAKEE